MNPSNTSRKNRWTIAAGVGCVAAGMVAGPLLMAGVIGGGDSDDDAKPGSSGTKESVATAAPSTTSGGPGEAPSGPPGGPEVVSWGQEGRRLAVVIRNDSDEVIDQARVRITGLNAAGRSVVSTTGPENHVCCTILGLPPGDEYGLYAPLRAAAAEITDVTVEYVAKDARPPSDKEASVVASGARLKHGDDNTVVRAVLTAEGPVGHYVAAQAFLVDSDGNVAQVISGRYWCYEPGTRRRIRLELFRAVPAGLRLDKVIAHSIPDGVPAGVKGAC